MRPRRLVLVLVVVLLALPLLLAGALWFAVTTDTVRHYAEAAVERATGHALRIAGPVHAVPSLIPTLVADDVALLNPPGFSRPDLAHARRVEIRMALLPLLRGIAEVRTLRFSGLDAKLEVNAAGQGNWQRPPAPVPTTPTAPRRAPRVAVSLRRIEVSGGALAWSSPGTAMRVDVPQLSAELGTSGQPLALDATISGMGGTARLQGTLADPASLRGLDATLSAQVADLAAFVPGAPPLHNVVLTTHLTDPDGLERGISANGLSITLPQGDLAGDLTVAWKPRPALHGALRSRRLDADALLGLPRERQATPGPAVTPQQAPPAPAPARARLIPDTLIPVAGLRGIDADLSYGAEALRLGSMEFRTVQAGVHLANGVLRVDPLTAASPGGPVQASASLDGAATPPRLSLNLAAPSLGLAAFVPGASGAAGLDADLRGQGATMRAIAGALDGVADVTAVDGQIDLARLGALGAALHRAGVPVALSGQAHLRCFALRAVASGGVATLDPILLDAGRLGLNGTGRVNFGDETLDLHLRAALRVGPAGAEVPLRITGTLAEPTIEAERVSGRFSLKISGAQAADACGPALATARGGRPGPEPAPAPPPRAERPADLLRDLLR